MLVSVLGWGLLSSPLIIGSVLLIARLFSGPATIGTINGAGLVGLLGVLGFISALGYGLLVLNRLSFWILAVMVLLGSILDLVDRIQIGTLSVFTFAGYGATVWFLLNRSVRTAFRY